MKIFKQNLLCVSLATLALTGCGSSDNNDGASDDHDHEHESSILVSQTGTTALSLLEDGELEFVGDALGNSVVDAPITLVLSETGSYAAVLNVSSTTVSFVHGLHEEHEDEEEGGEAHEEEHEEEAHVLEFSLPGTQVIATNGHFAVLNGGMTTFVAYDELENESPVTEVFDAVAGQDYPALILDEAHELVLAFDGVFALVYKGGSQELLMSCGDLSSYAQTYELVALTCDGSVSVLEIEGNSETGEYEFNTKNIVMDSSDTFDSPDNYIWRAMGEVIVGFEPNTTNYAFLKLNETSSLFEFSNAICDMQFDSQASDILAITAGGQFVALDHEGGELKAITLDESAESTCGDFVMAAASKTAIVVDNEAQMAYEIDVDDVENNPNSYHIHERAEITVSDISSMVIFHEIEAGEHEH